MPASLPDAATLLKAAIRFMEEELLPELAGYHRFKTRVTVNVLSTIKRELELRTSQEKRESEGLADLLGHRGEVAELSRELAQRIREGAISPDDQALHEHLRGSLREALSINNPKWTVS
jgi:hypothetical protein